MRHARARWCTGIAVLVLFLLPLGHGARANPLRRDVLLQQAANEKVRVRNQATADLARLLTRGDVPWLVRVLNRNQNKLIRLAAVTLLDHFQDRYAIGVLIKTLREDPNDERTSTWIRGRAARALGRMDWSRPSHPKIKRSVQHWLVDALNREPSSWVRLHAAHALVEMLGTGARPLLQAAIPLAAALQDPHEGYVKRFCRQSIDRIDAGAHLPRGRYLTKVAHIRAGWTKTGWLNGSKYLVYAPPSYNRDAPDRGLSDAPLLVSVHGSVGDAEPYLNMCIEDAKRHRHLVLAPHFDHGAFPVFGDVVYKHGWIRADEHLLDLVKMVGEEAQIPVQKINIFGHSQGGQFVHRFVLAHPDRIRRAAACASGFYVDLEEDDAFPCGNQPNPLMPDVRIDIGRLVTSRLAIVIGTRDRTPDKPDHRSRITAARNFASQIRRYAERHGLNSKVATRYVQAGPHSGERNYPTASQSLFSRLWILSKDF